MEENIPPNKLTNVQPNSASLTPSKSTKTQLNMSATDDEDEVEISFNPKPRSSDPAGVPLVTVANSPKKNIPEKEETEEERLKREVWEEIEQARKERLAREAEERKKKEALRKKKAARAKAKAAKGQSTLNFRPDEELTEKQLEARRKREEQRRQMLELRKQQRAKLAAEKQTEESADAVVVAAPGTAQPSSANDHAPDSQATAANTQLKSSADAQLDSSGPCQAETASAAPTQDAVKENAPEQEPVKVEPSNSDAEERPAKDLRNDETQTTDNQRSAEINKGGSSASIVVASNSHTESNATGDKQCTSSCSPAKAAGTREIQQTTPNANANDSHAGASNESPNDHYSKFGLNDISITADLHDTNASGMDKSIDGMFDLDLNESVFNPSVSKAPINSSPIDILDTTITGMLPLQTQLVLLNHPITVLFSLSLFWISVLRNGF